MRNGEQDDKMAREAKAEQPRNADYGAGKKSVMSSLIIGRYFEKASVFFF